MSLAATPTNAPAGWREAGSFLLSECARPIGAIGSRRFNAHAPERLQHLRDNLTGTQRNRSAIRRPGGRLKSWGASPFSFDPSSLHLMCPLAGSSFQSLPGLLYSCPGSVELQRTQRRLPAMQTRRKVSSNSSSDFPRRSPSPLADGACSQRPRLGLVPGRTFGISS